MSPWTCSAYLCIVFLFILPIVCLLGFLHVVHFENVCCVVLVYCGLDTFIVF